MKRLEVPDAVNYPALRWDAADISTLKTPEVRGALSHFPDLLPRDFRGIAEFVLRQSVQSSSQALSSDASIAKIGVDTADYLKY